MTKHLFMARRFSRENVVFFFFKSLSLSLVMSVHAGSAHWDTPTMRRGTRTEQVSFCQTFQDQISPHSSRFFFFFPRTFDTTTNPNASIFIPTGQDKSQIQYTCIYLYIYIFQCTECGAKCREFNQSDEGNDFRAFKHVLRISASCWSCDAVHSRFT